MKKFMMVILAATSLSFGAHAFEPVHATTERQAFKIAQSDLVPKTKLELVSNLMLQKAHAQDATATPAPEYKEPQSIGEAAAFIPTLIKFAKNSQWLLFGAVMTMILAFIIRQYVLPKVGATTAWLPIIAPILGVLTGVGGAVLAGSTGTAALLAVLSGPLGSNLWEAVMKYFFPRAPESVRQS